MNSLGSTTSRAALCRLGAGKERRVIAKIEWHPGELFPRVGFIVTNLPMEPDEVTRFYNRRGTAEQHIKEGKYAFRWTRLSCKKFRDNEVRLQLHALAYNLATFLRCIELPEAMADWSLTSLQLKLIKIGARVVRHARAITFQLAEVAVTGPMVRANPTSWTRCWSRVTTTACWHGFLRYSRLRCLSPARRRFWTQTGCRLP